MTMANNVDPDEMAQYEPFHLDLHCLHRYLFWSDRLKGLTPFHTCPLNKHLLPVEVSKRLLDECKLLTDLTYSVASDLGLHCLLSPVCPSTKV